MSFEAITYPQVSVPASVSILQTWIESNLQHEPTVLIGSSLGGFYAQYFGNLYSLGYAMINPALNVNLFSKHFGVHQNPNTLELVTVDYELLKGLISLDVTSVKRELPVLLLMDQDDQVIDVTFAQNKYRPVDNAKNNVWKTQLYPGGSHDFEHLDESMSPIMEWICLANRENSKLKA